MNTLRFTLLLISFIILSGQEKFPYKIVNADTQEIFNQERTVLTGNVILEKDTIIIFCKKAILFSEKEIRLIGAVKIKSGSSSIIQADSAKININTGLSRFYENVRFWNTKGNAQSDSMWFNYNTNEIHFFQDVKVINTVDSSEVYGNHVISKDNNSFVVYDSAKYLLLSDSMQVLSNLLRFDRRTKVATVTGQVEIFRNKLHATARRGQFNRVDSLVKLYDDAVVYFQNSEMRGDSIFAFLSPSGVKRIDIHGSAYTLNVIDSSLQKINRISGHDIYLYFENKKIKRLRSLHNAVSIHYFQDILKDNGINSVSADSLHIDFADGKVVQVKIFGGVKGTFYPPNYRGIIKDDY